MCITPFVHFFCIIQKRGNFHFFASHILRCLPAYSPLFLDRGGGDTHRMGCGPPCRASRVPRCRRGSGAWPGGCRGRRGLGPSATNSIKLQPLPEGVDEAQIREALRGPQAPRGQGHPSRREVMVRRRPLTETPVCPSPTFHKPSGSRKFSRPPRV